MIIELSIYFFILFLLELFRRKNLRLFIPISIVFFIFFPLAIWNNFDKIANIYYLEKVENIKLYESSLIFIYDSTNFENVFVLFILTILISSIYTIIILREKWSTVLILTLFAVFSIFSYKFYQSVINLDNQNKILMFDFFMLISAVIVSIVNNSALAWKTLKI